MWSLTGLAMPSDYDEILHSLLKAWLNKLESQGYYMCEPYRPFSVSAIQLEALNVTRRLNVPSLEIPRP